MFSYIGVFAWLGSSDSFLSMIFGIFGKFWIDIGEEKKSKNVFRRQKQFSTKIFENVFSKKMTLFEKKKTKNLKIEILKIFTFLKFRNFQNFDFQKN